MMYPSWAGLIVVLLSSAVAELPPAAPLADVPMVNPLAARKQGCPPISRFEANGRKGKARLRTLDKLPDSDIYLSVQRRIGGCIAPIIVNPIPDVHR